MIIEFALILNLFNAVMIFDCYRNTKKTTRHMEATWQSINETKKTLEKMISSSRRNTL